MLTGLRKGELASLTVGQLELDGPTPSAMLHAADEKNRQGSQIALRADLAADLAQWMADKLNVAQDAAKRDGGPVPMTLPANTPLFDVPTGLVRIMDRDLTMAGIGKRDNRGWTVDVHALRTTFGTLLSKGGVSLRTAQAAMRHSDPSLTANVYTDPRLLDVAGALDSLPTLPLAGNGAGERARMTGTYAAGPLAPTLAPSFDNAGSGGASADKMASEPGIGDEQARRAVNPCPVNKKRPLTFPVNGRSGVEAMRVELTTSCMPCKRSPN